MSVLRRRQVARRREADLEIPRFRVGLAVVLIVAAVLRFTSLNWDGGLGAHPDERHIVAVAEGLRWPGSLNPFEVAPGFAYGHLPVYLLAGASALLRPVDPLLLGRALAALFDLGTVGLTAALGRRVYGERVALLSAAFVALAVGHVQQARFYISDVPLAFFALGALLAAARLAGRGRWNHAWLAGVWAGLAAGTKFSGTLLALPLAAACALAPVAPSRRWRRALACGLGALAAFALTNPFALVDFPMFWRNVAVQGAIARGALDVPFTRQFHGTWPYLYPMSQQFRWAMGWPLGLIAFSGLTYALWRAVRRPPRPAEWVILAWTVPGFAFFGALYARFPRYLLPFIPLLVIYGARLINDLIHLRPLRSATNALLTIRPYLFLYLYLSIYLLYLSLSSLSLLAMYRAPHPWLSASAWIHDHVPPGSVIAVEQWDHPLPLDATGYVVRELPVFEEDGPEKWATIEGTLAVADVVVMASKRGYATLARWPERYPTTARYYRALFEGELEFEPVACFARHPHLGPVALVDDPAAGLDFSLPEICRPQAPVVLRLGRLDESLVVYDHPQVLVFRRE
jgi:4-amino-4-deoxy-L-arabinose transferase-like glycosyltransferase